MTNFFIAFSLFLLYHINWVRKMHKTKNESNTGNEKEIAPDQAFYRDWHEALPEKETRTVDILSDGILRQKDYSLLFERRDCLENHAAQNDIPVMNTNVINIYSNVILDAGFFKRVADSGITVNFFGQTGKLLGQFTPVSPLRSPRMTLRQLEEYYDGKKRVSLATQFVLASIHNLRLVIRYYNKMSPDALYDSMLKKIESINKPIKQRRSGLMGLSFCQDGNGGARRDMLRSPLPRQAALATASLNLFRTSKDIPLTSCKYGMKKGLQPVIGKKALSRNGDGGDGGGAQSDPFRSPLPQR